MNAILVSVDFTDLLALTLPYNRHHFDRVTVVTSHADFDNVLPVAEASGADVVMTNAFYDNGATFNKWAALERGLDLMGRKGWICLMDVDIVWPKDAGFSPLLPRENLYTPRRRIKEDIKGLLAVPSEHEWRKYPITQRHEEFAGYTQVFHAEDPVLGPPPWHQVDWKHAGGADSFFQAKWPESRKVRPPFEVLHLGRPGQDWCGRVSERLDGTVPKDADKHRVELGCYLSLRRGKGRDRFDHERLR